MDQITYRFILFSLLLSNKHIKNKIRLQKKILDPAFNWVAPVTDD